MPSTEHEIPLHGGEMQNVVRVGNTVRRQGGAWTPTIHALLKHLEKVGFEGAPRALGFDEQGREVLSFIEGEVTSGGRTPHAYMWSSGTLTATAKLLKRVHEATSTFKIPTDAKWLWKENATDGTRVICHNDIALWNTVFRHQKPVAFIDWDLAAPGPAESEVAYALWCFVPLWHDEKPRPGMNFGVQDRAKRIRLFCDAYGLSKRDDIFDRIRAKQNAVITEVKRIADEGSVGYQKLWDRGMREGILKDQAFLDRNAQALGAEL